MTLTRQEKALYNQIHPAKLATDWSTTFVAAYLFWQHELLVGLAVAFIPAIVASALVVKYADLERARDSRFGRYVKTYMTPSMEAVRAVGAAVVFVGVWFQMLWAIPVGVVIVLLGWLRGILTPARIRPA